MREIARLRQDYEQSAEQVRKAPEQPAKKAQPQPQEDDSARQTRELLDKIASLQQAPAEEPKPQPQSIYVSQDDNDLIRKIQQLRDNNAGKDSDELVEQIKKLLDGVE